MPQMAPTLWLSLLLTLILIFLVIKSYIYFQAGSKLEMNLSMKPANKNINWMW